MHLSTFAIVLSVLMMASLLDAFPTKSHQSESSEELFDEKEELAREFSESNMEILHEMRNTLRKTQARLRLILSLERGIKRTARHIAQKINKEELIIKNMRKTKSANKISRRHPFHAWAG